MSSAIVTCEITRLDVLSRQRALTEGESRQLQKMITTQRRYASMQRANNRALEAQAGAKPACPPNSDAPAAPPAGVSEQCRPSDLSARGTTLLAPESHP